MYVGEWVIKKTLDMLWPEDKEFIKGPAYALVQAFISLPIESGHWNRWDCVFLPPQITAAIKRWRESKWKERKKKKKKTRTGEKCMSQRETGSTRSSQRNSDLLTSSPFFPSRRMLEACYLKVLDMTYCIALYVWGWSVEWAAALSIFSAYSIEYVNCQCLWNALCLLHILPNINVPLHKLLVFVYVLYASVCLSV